MDITDHRQIITCPCCEGTGWTPLIDKQTAIARMIAGAMSTYRERGERAALRCALGDAAALCDRIAMEVLAAHRTRSGKGPPSKLGMQLCDAVKTAGNEIWAMREKITVDTEAAP